MAMPAMYQRPSMHATGCQSRGIWHTRLPDRALWKLRAETAEACPKLLALVKLSSRPAGSANVSSLSLGRPLELAGAF